MAATILDAIQDIATPAMIQSATSTLGLSETAATATLGTASTSILGGLIQKSGDAATMTKVAALVNGLDPDAGMFANMTGLLSGGLPASGAQLAGNRLLGLAFGDRMALMMGAVATATQVSPKAASGLTTLAAPMVLAALRSRLGGSATPASVASLLTTDRNLITTAMPASLRTLYGLTGGAPVAAAPAAVAATVAPKGPPAPLPIAPTVATPTATNTNNARPAAPVATAPVAATNAPMAPSTARSVPVAPPVRSMPAAAPALAQAAEEESGTRLLPALGILLPLAILAGLLWYWAYGVDSSKPAAPKAAPAATAPAPAAAPAPAPAAPAAAASIGPVPGANGAMKYTLPGGASIEVDKDGLEAKLISFITSKDAVDTKLWFDFDHLSFVTGSSDLAPESKVQVANAVAILKAFPAVHIKIGGYTDNQGDPDANLKLSDQRANAVMAAMVASGVAADRMEAKGYGDQFPIGDNGTAEGRAKNRRTSLSVRAK